MKDIKETIQFITLSNHSGQRIDKLLSLIYPEYSRSYVKKLILQGALFIDSENVIDVSIKVLKNQTIKLIIPKTVQAKNKPENIPLDILYEDDYLLVINKKAGMVVHPGPGNFDKTLVNALLFHCGDNLSGIGGIKRPGIIHRLDKDTSGLLIVAKNDDAHRLLSKDISLKKVQRIYQTFIWGSPTLVSGEINHNIARDPNDRLKMTVVNKAGRNAITHYKVLEYYKFASKIECQLLTGRTHQIRVHLSHIGFPIIGDKTYTIGRNRSKIMPEIMTNFNRQALHSCSISFRHPKSKKQMVFNKDLPDDMKILEKELKKNNI